MRLRVQVVVENDDGETEVVREAFELKAGPLAPDTVGLGLAEAKELLAAVQETVVEEQVKAALAEQEHCRDCGARHRHKDARTIVVRTLFGTRRLRSPRWHRCGCHAQPTITFSPLAALLPERTTPELATSRRSSPGWCPTASAPGSWPRSCPWAGTCTPPRYGVEPTPWPAASKTSSAPSRASPSSSAPCRICPAPTFRWWWASTAPR
ncbi:MAG: hypothetical protein ACRDYV_14960 [Acidimicrobiia bacterium]